MKKRFCISFLAFVLIAALLLAGNSGRAYAVTQEEIEELRKERLALAEEQGEKQAIVDELEAEKASLLERKLAMDERNELTRREIANIQEEIDLYDQMIAEEAFKVEQAKTLEVQQLERYRIHVRAMEENGEMGYLALILGVENLSELLTALDDAGAIMHSDQELYNDYIAAREHTEQVKAEYEQTRSELESHQDELRAQQAELEKDIEEASRLVSELDEDITLRNQEIHELLLAEIQTAEKLEQLIAQQERERGENNNGGGNGGGGNGGGGNNGGGNNGGSVTGSGTFCWPCPGCTYVTSRFGNRFHPIFEEWRYHSGLDIGASYGSAVVASDGGTVILAEVNGGYGNCIMIDHGNSYYTLYGHLSGYAVSSGQAVSKGQTIGYVGDSGWATGPHLHFEIRLGSGCIDPEQFFSGLTFAPDAGD